MKSTLIISTYNWPEALELVLFSVKNQSKFPYEIIIADDGSTSKTKQIIDAFKKDFKIPLYHTWQEDMGFRKSQILNKAIAKANGDYIIQVDGDCIMHTHFIKDHLQFAQKNTYLYGSRVNIQKRYLPALFKNKQIHFNLFSKGIKKRTRALYLPFLSQFYKKNTTFSSKFRGCNTSFFKSDFIAVNGYNEDITGWGREDSELMLRFHNRKVMARRLRYRGIVFHIYHKGESRDQAIINTQIEQDTIRTNKNWTANGVNKYLSDEEGH